MKFDVIVGNPPYNAASSAKRKLWPSFVDASLKIDPSHILFVTPTSWAYGETSFSKTRESLSAGLRYADLGASRHFPGVGQSISVWHWERDHIGPSIVKLPDASLVEHDFKDRLLDSDGTIFDSIRKRVFATTDRLHLRTCNFPKSVLSQTGSDEYPYRVQYSASQLLYSRRRPQDYSLPKVFINRSGNYWTPNAPDKYIHFMHEGVAGRLGAHVIVRDGTEALHLIQILRSKLFVSLIQFKGTRNNGFKDDIYLLPRLDTTRPWTDADLYGHFGLTPEERAHVESTVK